LRITNSILYRQSLSGLRKNLEAMEEAAFQASTGIRLRRPSDDPVATGSVMRSSSSLRALEQYQRNLNLGRSRLGAEEGVLEQLGDALVRAKELAIGQSGSNATTDTRAITALEVASLRDFVQDLANTEFAGSYLFGGAYADTVPFPDGGPDPTRLPEGELPIEIAAGSTVPTNHSGKRVFMDSGALDALSELQAALEADDAAGVQSAIGSLDRAFTDVQQVTAEVGARARRLDVATSNLEALDVNLRTFRSDLQDADFEAAVSELINRQTGYQAALLANARILQTTLTDYLR
jgi:flagellar hook-associated protein 3 FlgL